MTAATSALMVDTAGLLSKAEEGAARTNAKAICCNRCNSSILCAGKVRPQIRYLSE